MKPIDFPQPNLKSIWNFNFKAVTHSQKKNTKHSLLVSRYSQMSTDNWNRKLNGFARVAFYTLTLHSLANAFGKYTLPLSLCLTTIPLFRHISKMSIRGYALNDRAHDHHSMTMPLARSIEPMAMRIVVVILQYAGYISAENQHLCRN